jgi:deferrochelatase/peroxidase EfeB
VVDVTRRGLFGAGLGIGLATAASAVAATSASEALAATAPRSFPFEGPHQQGILTPPQKHAAIVSFDVTASSRADVMQLLREITDRARFLTTGGAPSTVGIAAPEVDSGVLGPVVPADGLTVTASVGSSLFDSRFGLASAKPTLLRPMETFANDALQPEWCHGDLLLQLCADNNDTVAHALRDIARATRGGMQVRWRKDGFVSPPRPSGAPRNLLGFKDGTGNPKTDAATSAALVWASANEPAWAAGGSYHVVRIIRMLVEFWDRVSLLEQEGMIGRHRDSGAPLDGTKETDKPRFDIDGTGEVTPFGAHIRLANPRTPQTANQQMLRRPYNYDSGVDANGNLDMGMLFTAFNQDLERQFVTVQKRLADEALVDYISPFGGGYFFALPGVTSASDWLGRGMFA